MSTTAASASEAIDTEPSASQRRAAIVIGLTALDLVALSIWLGGLVAIGAMVAPSAFEVARSAPSLAGNAAAQNAVAGGIVGASLKLYNSVSLVCAAILLTSAARVRSAGRAWPRILLTAGCALAAGMTVFEQFALFPAMDSARAAGSTSFNSMHHEYEALAQVQLFVLLSVAFAYAGVNHRTTSP